MNCNAKKPDGISFVSEGPVYEELVMSIVKRNVFRKEKAELQKKANEAATEALKSQGDVFKPFVVADVSATQTEIAVDPTEEFHATETKEAE